jgi:hypothetical protein
MEMLEGALFGVGLLTHVKATAPLTTHVIAEESGDIKEKININYFSWTITGLLE